MNADIPARGCLIAEGTILNTGLATACGALRGYGRPHVFRRPPRSREAGSGIQGCATMSLTALGLIILTQCRRRCIRENPRVRRENEIDDAYFGINYPGTGAYWGCKTCHCTRARLVERLLDKSLGPLAVTPVTQIQGLGSRGARGGPRP